MKKNYTTLTLMILTLCLYTLSGRGQTKLGGNINGTQGNTYSGGNIIAQGEESGHSVSVSANGKIVAIGSDLYSTQKGRVRIYEYTAGTWRQLGAHIVGEADYDWFGHSVSLSADGKTVAIGATGNNASGNEATANVWDDYDGHVRVYTYNGTSWTQLGADIDGPNGKNDQLGFSVSLSADGRTVAIGARGYDQSTTITNVGRVQVYKYNSTNTTWEEVGAAINGEAAGDQSGYSVSLSPDGKTVAIGSPFHDVTETTTTATTTNADVGQVRVYKYSGNGTTGTWSKVGDNIDGATAGENAGWSVSLSADGKTVAIGAPGYKVGSLTKAGRVQVYQYNGTEWTQEGSDVKSGGNQDKLGENVSLSADGKTVAFGIGEFDLGGTNIGRTMVYQYSGNSWTQRADIRGQAGGDASGSSVALSADGTTLATGSPKHNHGRGHVRVYQFFQITSASTASVAENTETAAYTITAGGTPTFTLGTAKDEALFNLNDSEVTFKTPPDFENPTDGNTDNVYEIQITATSGGESITKDVKITVTNVVEAPVFSSGATASVAENATGTGTTTTTVYTAAATAPASGTSVTFSLEAPSTEAAVNVDDDNDKFTIDGSTGEIKFKTAHVPDFENPGSAANSNVYNVQITATAGSETATKDVTIRVTNEVEAPVFTSAATQEVAENTTATGYTAAATKDVSVTDPVVFSLATAAGVTGEPIKDNGLFEIDATTGAVSFKTAPDFENPMDTHADASSTPPVLANDNLYEIQIKAVAGTTGASTLTKIHDVTITVTNVVEAPVFTSDVAASTPENATASGGTGTSTVYTATTGTDTDAAAFTLEPPSTDAAVIADDDNDKFTIDGTTGEVKFVAAPDFETPGSAANSNVYNIQITATAGTQTATHNVTITVTDVLEFSNTTFTASLAENTPITDVLYTFTSATPAVTYALVSGFGDNDKFTIASDGTVTFKAIPDFENPADTYVNDSNPGAVAGDNVYHIQVTATASIDGSSQTATKDVTITVTNVVEAPVFTSDVAASTPENATGTVYTATTGTDTDEAVFSLAPGVKDNDLFAISSGEISFKTAPDFENPEDKDGKNDYQIQITATSGAGSSAKTVTKTATVRVTNVVEAPVFSSAAMASVAENTPIATVIYTASVSDASTKDMVTFSLVSTANDNAKFTIDGSTGVVKFKTAPDFENPEDKDGKNDYQIQITATSGAGSSAKTVTKTVTVRVTNVVEAPVFSSAATASVAENTPIATVIYTASVSDASTKDMVTFSLVSTDDDNAQFTIDGSTGVVKFKTAPDFESPVDADGNNDYNVQITATVPLSAAQAGSGTSAKTVTKDVVITVTDVPEQGTIALPEALAFDDTKVGETVSKALTISNPSAVALNVSAITYPTGFTGDWTEGNIAAGGEQVVNVSFKPTEAKAYTGTITVTSDAANTTEGKNTLTVSGKGILVTGLTAKGGTSEQGAAFPGLSVFPNPAEDVLHVKLPNQNRPVALQLTDTNGQVIYEQEAVTSDELSLDVSGYKSGVYLLVLRSGSKVEKRKVVIK